MERREAAATRTGRRPTWRDAGEVFDLAHVVGCTRPGYEMDEATPQGIPEDRVTIVETRRKP